MRRGFLALVLLAALVAPASAQPADFLFRKPAVTIGIRGGWAVPRAQSEIFDFTRQQLTVERGDFSSPVFQLEIAGGVWQRLDLALGVGVSESTIQSESRDFIGTDDLPIKQTTRFRRVPITAGVKAYFKDRGRSVSRFAWVPASWAPWAGVGVGGMYSIFDQNGEFVDYQTLDIFRKDFRSTAFTPVAHVSGGVDFSLGPHFLATGEARYLWAKADMGNDFVDFDRIDLSGFQITAGVSARF